MSTGNHTDASDFIIHDFKGQAQVVIGQWLE